MMMIIIIIIIIIQQFHPEGSSRLRLTDFKIIGT